MAGLTLQKKAVLEAIAAALGITYEELEDMDGLNILDGLFPDISNEQVDIITSGSADVIGVENAGNNSFDIYVGPTGTDIITNPDFVLHFDII